MPDNAPAGLYRADPNHSSVLFRIKHLALSWYTGRFTRLSAELYFDPDHLDDMHLTADVELGSVRAEYQGTDKNWDRDLADSPHFLDALSEPTARFVSTRVELSSEERAAVHGDMTFRGYTHPFVFDTVYNGAMLDHPTGAKLIGFSATGLLIRSDYGLTFGLGPRMPDEVQIIVEAEFALVA